MKGHLKSTRLVVGAALAFVPAVVSLAVTRPARASTTVSSSVASGYVEQVTTKSVTVEATTNVPKTTCPTSNPDATDIVTVLIGGPPGGPVLPLSGAQLQLGCPSTVPTYFAHFIWGAPALSIHPGDSVTLSATVTAHRQKLTLIDTTSDKSIHERLDVGFKPLEVEFSMQGLFSDFPGSACRGSQGSRWTGMRSGTCPLTVQKRWTATARSRSR